MAEPNPTPEDTKLQQPTQPSESDYTAPLGIEATLKSAFNGAGRWNHGRRNTQGCAG